MGARHEQVELRHARLRGAVKSLFVPRAMEPIIRDRPKTAVPVWAQQTGRIQLATKQRARGGTGGSARAVGSRAVARGWQAHAAVVVSDVRPAFPPGAALDHAVEPVRAVGATWCCSRPAARGGHSLRGARAPPNSRGRARGTGGEAGRRGRASGPCPPEGTCTARASLCERGAWGVGRVSCLRASARTAWCERAGGRLSA